MSQSKRKYKPNRGAKAAKKSFPVILLVLGGLLLAAAGLFLALRPDESPETSGGTPRLAVDREKIDFGDVHFNQPVTATFELTNTGDGTLRLTSAPIVQVKEGC